MEDLKTLAVAVIWVAVGILLGSALTDRARADERPLSLTELIYVEIRDQVTRIDEVGRSTLRVRYRVTDYVVTVQEVR